MDYLKKGLTKSLVGIKKHKVLFIGIFLLQLLFLASFVGVSLAYQVKIFENAQNIIVPLQNANFDVDSIQEGQPFMKDVLKIYNSYQAMVKDIYIFFLWLALIFLVIGGGIWLLTHHLLGKTVFLRSWLKFIASTIVLILPFFLISYFLLQSILKLGLAIDTFTLIIRVLPYLFFVVYYFLLIGFAFIDVKSWKSYLQKIWEIGIKKIHFTLIVLLINSVIIFLSLLFVYYGLQLENFAVMTISALVLVLVLVLVQIYWIACLQEINNEKIA